MVGDCSEISAARHDKNERNSMQSEEKQMRGEAEVQESV